MRSDTREKVIPFVRPPISAEARARESLTDRAKRLLDEPTSPPPPPDDGPAAA